MLPDRNAAPTSLLFGLVALAILPFGCSFGWMWAASGIFALVGMLFGVRSFVDLDNDLRIVGFAGLAVNGLLLLTHTLAWIA